MQASMEDLMTIPRHIKICLLLVASTFSISRSQGQTPVTVGNLEDAKITSRIESFKDLPPEAREKISQDLQTESKKHYGFETIKTVDETFTIDIGKLHLSQKKLIDETTMHVVD